MLIEGGVGAHMSCYSAEIYQESLNVQELHRKKWQRLGVNFDRFTAILVLKKKQKKQWCTAAILQKTLDVPELHIKINPTLGVNFELFTRILMVKKKI